MGRLVPTAIIGLQNWTAMINESGANVLSASYLPGFYQLYNILKLKCNSLNIQTPSEVGTIINAFSR